MSKITTARAVANNEVAYLGWQTEPRDIPGCLGFCIVRQYLDPNDQVTSERPLASYIPFKGQRNPNWQAQNTTVWPVQKFTWRDLTLRRKRDGSGRRPENERVRYMIRAVGAWREGLEKVIVIPEAHKDRETGATISHTYDGPALELGYLTAPAFTNPIDVTGTRGPFRSTFTNGILSTQFIVNVLNRDGEIKEGELQDHLVKPGDWLRNLLTGDVLPLIREFFERHPGGRFKAALYELEDEELIALLETHADSIDLILSDAGSGDDEDDQTIYDTRNADARKRLRKIAKQPGSSFTMQDRMFNGTGHIGHNKFVVSLDEAGKPESVLTGSTNWTWSGLSGQSNNCIRIDDADVAQAFSDYWDRLYADKQPTPKPLSAKASGAGQDDPLKEANQTPATASIDGGKAELWFSPNMPGYMQLPKSKTKPTPPPPDVSRLFQLMRKAEKAIFFLVFMPSRGGLNSIVAEAVNLGLKDPDLNVIGAISDTQAMWGFEPGEKTDTGKKKTAWSPHVFRKGRLSVVRATALTDKEIGRELGDFKIDEKLTLGRAIIHDKILVIDPLDPEKCVVAFGSHNLGYKASYSNDENLVVIRGHAPLAQAYMTHVLDVYDHYRFRAVEAEITAAKKGKKANVKGKKGWDGFLSKSESWQEKSNRFLAAYLTE